MKPISIFVARPAYRLDRSPPGGQIGRVCRFPGALRWSRGLVLANPPEVGAVASFFSAVAFLQLDPWAFLGDRYQKRIRTGRVFPGQNRGHAWGIWHLRASYKSVVPIGFYPITQIYQAEEDRTRGDQTFAAWAGADGRLCAMCLKQRHQICKIPDDGHSCAWRCWPRRCAVQKLRAQPALRVG